jgi:hypothetical protein
MDEEYHASLNIHFIPYILTAIQKLFVIVIDAIKKGIEIIDPQTHTNA